MGQSKHFQWLSVWFSLIALDQLSKWFFQPLSLNTGISFGWKIGSSAFVQLALVVVVFGALSAWICSLFSSLGRLSRWGVVLVMAGAFSNILDRVFLGGVRDWLVFPFFGFTNNIADIWITLGVFCILIAGATRTKL